MRIGISPDACAARASSDTHPESSVMIQAIRAGLSFRTNGPLRALMFAIMETAIVFFASQTLETAVADSARLIMTGQAQSQGFTQAQFKTAVCAKILGLFDCA